MEQQRPLSTLPTPNGLQVRQRSCRACRPCQQRRRKCNGAEPCATCVGYGYECHYIRHDAKGISKKRHEPRYTKLDGSTTSESPLETTPKEHIRHEYQGSPATSHDVLDLTKSRFVGGHSAFAFPMNLGKELNALHPPRLHSFAVNAGTRKEPKLDDNLNINAHLTREDVRRLSEKYFAIAHPIFGFINRPLFESRCNDQWNGTLQSIVFQATVAGVCAIGSLFSGPDSFPNEESLTQFMKKVLEFSNVVRCISHDYVAAWILHSIYLRSTTRPHASWIAISTTMHVAESVGLHREHDTVVLASPSGGTSLVLSEDDIKYRRRTFWVAWALNQTFSCEYGRTPTYIRDINCRQPTAIEGDYTTELVTVVRLFYATEVNTPDPRLEETKLLAALSSLTLSPSEPALLTLLKVDKAFCIYRRLRLLSSGTASAQMSKILQLGQASLATARGLAADDIVWWNILGTPFQYLCILLAADTLDSLAMVPEAMAALEAISLRLGTHLACEAMATARLLVHASQRKKMRQMELLSGGGGGGSGSGVSVGGANKTPVLPHEEAVPAVPAMAPGVAPAGQLNDSCDDGVGGGGGAVAGMDVMMGTAADDEIQSDCALAQGFSDGNIDWDELLRNGIGQAGNIGIPGGFLADEI